MLNNANGQTQKTLETHERHMYHESHSETSATTIQNYPKAFLLHIMSKKTSSTR